METPAQAPDAPDQTADDGNKENADQAAHGAESDKQIEGDNTETKDELGKEGQQQQNEGNENQQCEDDGMNESNEDAQDENEEAGDTNEGQGVEAESDKGEQEEEGTQAEQQGDEQCQQEEGDDAGDPDDCEQGEQEADDADAEDQGMQDKCQPCEGDDDKAECQSLDDICEPGEFKDDQSIGDICEACEPVEDENEGQCTSLPDVCMPCKEEDLHNAECDSIADQLEAYDIEVVCSEVQGREDEDDMQQDDTQQSDLTLRCQDGLAKSLDDLCDEYGIEGDVVVTLHKLAAENLEGYIGELENDILYDLNKILQSVEEEESSMDDNLESMTTAVEKQCSDIKAVVDKAKKEMFGDIFADKKKRSKMVKEMREDLLLQKNKFEQLLDDCKRHLEIGGEEMQTFFNEQCPSIHSFTFHRNFVQSCFSPWSYRCPRAPQRDWRT